VKLKEQTEYHKNEKTMQLIKLVAKKTKMLTKNTKGAGVKFV